MASPAHDQRRRWDVASLTCPNCLRSFVIELKSPVSVKKTPKDWRPGFDPDRDEWGDQLEED